RCRLTTPFFRGPLGPIGGPLGREDMGAIPEPIQQRRGQLLIAKHLHPFAKGEIARNDCGALAVAFGQDVKEQLAPSPFDRHKAEFVYDSEIVLHTALLDTPSGAYISCLHHVWTRR